MVSEAPTPPASGGLRARLARRVGPLPVWGWAVVVGGGAIVFVLARRRAGGAASGSGRTIAAETGEEGAVRGGGGGGGVGSARPTPPVSTWIAPAPVGPGAAGSPTQPIGAGPTAPVSGGPGAPGARTSVIAGPPPEAGGFFNPVTDPWGDTGFYAPGAEEQAQLQEDDPGQPGYGIGEDIADINNSPPPRTEADGRTYDAPEAQYDANGNVVGWG